MDTDNYKSKCSEGNILQNSYLKQIFENSLVSFKEKTVNLEKGTFNHKLLKISSIFRMKAQKRNSN